jgi:hypothetical protein
VTRLLILGMSHTRALRAALRPDERARIEVVNLRDHPELMDKKRGQLSLGRRSWERPDLLVLTLEGNLHNVFSLKENPRPFALGDAAMGAVPADPARHFVPYDMLREHFARRLRAHARMTAQAQAHFPGVPALHLAPPPPVRALRPLDPDGPPLEGAALMMRYLAFDAAPPSLRVRIHAVQTDLARAEARRLGAGFQDPPEAALSPDGLLADGFWDDDPTHGNARYGRLVLDAALARAAGLAPAGA